MGDVHVHNDPPRGDGGSSAVVWALVVLVLVGVIAWLVFGRGRGSGIPDKVDINIEAPAVGSGQ